MAAKKSTPQATDQESFEKIKVINLTIAPTDRSYKGIKQWRNALSSAESVTNPQRKTLLDLYDELALDPHMWAAMQKRINNVLEGEIKFFNAKGEEDEAVYNVIKQPFFTEFLTYALEAIFYGHSLIYFDNISVDGGSKCSLIPRKNVKPEKGIVVKNYSDDTGVSFTEPPTTSYVIAVGGERTLGLLNKAAPYVIYKKGDMADWATFAEIFGTPFRWAEYDGYDTKVKAELENMLTLAKTAAHAVLPQGTTVHHEESQNKSGSTDLYERLANFCDKQVSKLVLANTMTLDAEGGNYKGEVHEKSEMRVADFDKRNIISLLNTEFVRILGTFGINAEGGWFTYEDEPMSLEDIIKLSALIDIPAEYLYERFDIPMPTGTKSKKEPAKKSDDKEDETAKEDKELHDHHYHPLAAEKEQGILARVLRFFGFAPPTRG